jgi:long-chain fatty acid transport protein
MRPDDNDMKVTVTAHDLFVPRATFGAHAALGLVELGGSLTWSAPIDAVGDARTEGGAFAARVQAGDTSKIAHGDTSRRDCGQPGTDACGDGGNAHLTIPIPLEATVGVRFRVPRKNAALEGPRDPMEQEIGDVELDATWAQNSAIDRIGLSFPGAGGSGTIPVVGTAGALPPNADSSRRFKDVVGFRLGGDLAIVPGVIAIRAGTFVEPRAAVPGQVGLETLAGTRVGVTLGVTARIHQKSTRAFDVSLGFLHMFVADVTESDPRADGVRAITGIRCDGSTKDANGVCPDGGPAYRTKWPVGLGTISGALDVLHLGVAYRF